MIGFLDSGDIARVVVQLGALGVLGWLVYQLVAKTFPSYVESEREQREGYTKSMDEAREQYLRSIDEVTRRMDRLSDSVDRLADRLHDCDG